MQSPFPAPYTIVRPLPPYLGLLAVDAKGYTGEPGAAHAVMGERIQELVHESFGRCGLSHLWMEPAFLESTGDGFAMGIPTEHLPALVHPVLQETQRVLAAYNRSISRYEPQIRLRMSIHVGPLAIDLNRQHDTGKGTARNDTHRLLDSQPVKQILAEASPEVTHVAAVLSDRVFQDVIADGYTDRHPHHFISVKDAEVPGKNYRRDVWIYVPEPSGNLMRLAEPAAAAAGASERRATPAQNVPGVRVGHNQGQVVGTVNGGFHVGQPS